MIVRFRDLPELSPAHFRLVNSVYSCHIPGPAHLDLASGLIKVDDDFWLVGWCGKIDPHLMYGREGQIGLMFFSKDDGEVWEHYPLFDDDDRAAAKFDTKRGLLEPPALTTKGPA